MSLSNPALVRCLVIILLAFGATRLGVAQQPTQAEPQVERIKSNEVLLDVLFRDKKGKIVRDVRPEEIDIYEDGVKQKIASFRLVGPGAETTPATPPITGAITEQPLSLATIVLDRFDPGRVQRARETAFAFIDNALGEGVYARVCVIGRRLYLVEQFTNDRARLRKAIDRAVAPSEKALAENSDRLVKQLAAIASGDSTAATTAIGADVPMTITGGATGTEATLARLTVETITGSDKSMHDAKSTAPVFPLLHLGRAQRRLPGRKLVVYLSNGLYLNPGLSDALTAAISEANRANVTFYALDARILLASIGVSSSRLESETVVNATRRPESASYSDRYADSFSNNGTNGVTSNFNVFEVVRRRAELGKQTALSELAEQTGGSMITAVNDINGMLRRATAELGNYHLLSYSSTNPELDGKFRQVEVKVNRPGVTAQTRHGYFAVPPSAKRPSLAYETPLLAALNSGVVPRDFALRAAALRFESREKAPQLRESHLAVLLETGLADFIGAEDKERKSYPVDLALLALVKDENGEIVQSFSEHHPIEIPGAQIEDARKMNASLTRDFWLAPGRYTLEVAAHNRLNDRISAERRVFHVEPPATGLQFGSLYLIRQIEQVQERPADEADNPLFAGLTKLLPETAGELSLDNRPEIPFHLAVFPDAKQPPAPTLKLELLHEGRIVASTTPALPKPDAAGRITFTAAIPTKGLVAGRYELRALGKQGESTATESITFKLTGGPVAATATPTDDGKVIESRLAAADRFGELAIVAINAAKPVEIAVEDLLRETAANGAQMFRRLGEYTYSLRKVRRTLDRRGRIRAEDYNDYEAYPVRGLHALVHLTANGSRLSVDRIGLDRKQVTEELIDDEARRQAEQKPLSFWGARVGGYLPGNKYASILIDPEIFFAACEFSSPRAVTLDGRETVVLDFRARDEVKLEPEKEWVHGLHGSIWIDLMEKAMVRLEAQSTGEAPQTTQPVPNFVYQQQRLAEGLWSPQLIRINAAGDERLFRGLNWDAWFEFSAFQKFDSHESDVKLNAPTEKNPR